MLDIQSAIDELHRIDREKLHMRCFYFYKDTMMLRVGPGPNAQVLHVTTTRPLNARHAGQVTGGSLWCHVYDIAGAASWVRNPAPVTAAWSEGGWAVGDPKALAHAHAADRALVIARVDAPPEAVLVAKRAVDLPDQRRARYLERPTAARVAFRLDDNACPYEAELERLLDTASSAQAKAAKSDAARQMFALTRAIERAGLMAPAGVTSDAPTPGTLRMGVNADARVVDLDALQDLVPRLTGALPPGLQPY